MYPKMLGACFEGYIVIRYGLTDVLKRGFKHIHCDLADPIGYLTIVLTISSKFVYNFSPGMNVWSFIQVLNFGVIFKTCLKEEIEIFY
jgi:hypothetical protein